MIFTSYWSKLSLIPKEMQIYSISRWTPEWAEKYIDGHIFCFAPTEELLSAWKNGRINEEVYTEWYRRLILHTDLDKFIEWVGDRDIVLMCYEKPDEFCHRHLLAEILKDKGVECEELRF